MSRAMVGSPLLEVGGMCVAIGHADGIRAVDGVSLTVGDNEILGVVGESGSGKTLLTRAILGLLPPGVAVIDGQLRYRGQPLPIDRRDRGDSPARMGLIPQHANAALNPLVSVGRQVAAALRANGVSRALRKGRALELLDHLGLKDPAEVARQYPHQLSGGMQQRVVVAVALATEPELLVADEPTSALDPLVKLQFLDLLASIQRERQMSVILITHDLGVAARACDRVVVMYGGRVMEQGETGELLEEPAHPYTRGLMQAVPDLTRTSHGQPIPGNPIQARPSVDACPFADRCYAVHDRCRSQQPPMFKVNATHTSSCWLLSPVDQPTTGVRIQAR